MNARVLETKRLLLGERKLEILLEERDDGKWNLRFGRGAAEQLHLAVSSDEGNGTATVGELTYKAELFDHMVEHLQDGMSRNAAGAGETENMPDRLATYAKIGVCTEGLSDQALEAMAHEFMSQNYSAATLDEISAWSRDVLAIRRQQIEPTFAPPDLLSL
jgi:hypothetical protein